jgi:hypothetical protein
VLAPLASLPPEAVLATLGDRAAIGSGVRWFDGFEGDVRNLGAALPCAADSLLLPDDFTCLPPRPIYGRAPDAKPMAPAAA